MMFLSSRAVLGSRLKVYSLQGRYALRHRCGREMCLHLADWRLERQADSEDLVGRRNSRMCYLSYSTAYIDSLHARLESIDDFANSAELPDEAHGTTARHDGQDPDPVAAAVASIGFVIEGIEIDVLADP